MAIARLSIDIKAVIAILIDEITDSISILNDSGTTSGLTCFSIFGAPPPVLVRPLFTLLKGCLFSIGRIGSNTIPHIEDEEADHSLQPLLFLGHTEVLELSFGRVLPAPPEGDEVYRVREPHQRALHVRTDPCPSAVVSEGDLVIRVLIITECLVVLLSMCRLGQIHWMLDLHIRPLATRGQTEQSDCRYR